MVRTFSMIRSRALVTALVSLEGIISCCYREIRLECIAIGTDCSRTQSGCCFDWVFVIDASMSSSNRRHRYWRWWSKWLHLNAFGEKSRVSNCFGVSQVKSGSNAMMHNRLSHSVIRWRWIWLVLMLNAENVSGGHFVMLKTSSNLKLALLRTWCDVQWSRACYWCGRRSRWC